MRRFLVAALLVLAATTATIAVAVALPGQRTRATAAYLLLLGTLGAGAALARIFRRRRCSRSAFEAALTGPQARPTRLRALERIENDCIQGLANPVDFQTRLGPRLREIAAQRLAVRHGIDLEGRPEAARAVLGDELWELVRPDRPRPDEHDGPRIDSAALGRAIDTLEAV